MRQMTTFGKTKSRCSWPWGYIENGKTEPSLSTLEKIAKALGVSLSDFFATEDAIADVNSYDGSLMEKVKAIEALSDEEKKTVFSIVDAFAGKKKLKDALSGVLSDVKGSLPRSV
jgi:transcriptional regulator with XRE-family HTH domain